MSLVYAEELQTEQICCMSVVQNVECRPRDDGGCTDQQLSHLQKGDTALLNKCSRSSCCCFFYYKVESLIQTIVVSSVFHSGEPGLLVSKITARTPFSGYAGDLQQSEKKKLHNVFEKGDMFFNTGDLLSIDADNFIYFQDRVGDTFR